MGRPGEAAYLHVTFTRVQLFSRETLRRRWDHVLVVARPVDSLAFT